MATNNEELLAKTKQRSTVDGGKMSPVTFEKTMGQWFKDHGRRLVTFAGSESEAKKIVAGLLYAASRNPKLMTCTQESLTDCLMQSAQLGLYPGAAQEVAFLPFQNKKTGREEAQFVPMFQGLAKLAYEGGAVLSIEPGIVKEGDEFWFRKGSDPTLHHVPMLDGGEDRPVIAVYVVVRLKTGVRFEVRGKEWVENIRKKSPSGSYSNSPWATSWDEMAQKSVFKNMQKWLPKTEKLAKAIELDNEFERPDLAKPVVVPLQGLSNAIAEVKQIDAPKQPAATVQVVETVADKVALTEEEETAKIRQAFGYEDK